MISRIIQSTFKSRKGILLGQYRWMSAEVGYFVALLRLRHFWEKNSTAFIIHFHTITMISSKSMRFLLFADFFYIC